MGRSLKRNMRRATTSRKVTRRGLLSLSTVEHKRFALVNTANSNATAGSVGNLTNGIVQGDDINQRSGHMVKIIGHQLIIRASAITVNQTFRFIWFRDNMNRGTTPSVTEVLNSASFMSQYNPTTMQQKRFTILADVKLDCNVAGEAIKSRTLKCPGQDVFYNGATAVAASNGPGALFLLEIGDSITGLYDFSYEPVYIDA